MIVTFFSGLVYPPLRAICFPAKLRQHSVGNCIHLAPRDVRFPARGMRNTLVYVILPPAQRLVQQSDTAHVSPPNLERPDHDRGVRRADTHRRIQFVLNTRLAVLDMSGRIHERGSRSCWVMAQNK